MRGGRGSRKFRPEAEILGIFSIEVAPKMHQNTIPKVSFPSLYEIPEMSTGGDTGTRVSKCGLERSLYLPDAK